MKVICNIIQNVVITIVSMSTFSTFASINLIGAGATFPATVYIKWADTYQKVTGNRINYQGIGSSGGIKQIIANTVDFGASDFPLPDEKLNQEGLFQFPTLIGGIVVVVNLSGFGSNELVLDGKTLGDIYLGKIQSWDDKAIIKLNPHLKIPSKNIAVIRRADGSGTSLVFTSYLTKSNAEWKSKVGYGSTVNWPTGLGGKGNDGVSAFVQRIPGSIGYVEYAYARQNNLSCTRLISDHGKPIIPNEESISNAVKGVRWNKSFFYNLTDQKGEDDWPIISATFILVHKEQKRPEKGMEVLKFFDWSYENGNRQARELGYVGLPKSLVWKIRSAFKDNVKDSKGNSLY